MLPGRHTLDEAFHAAHYERRMHSWALRFIGWVILFFATICTSEILTVVLSDIPFFAILLPNPNHPLYGIILLSLSMAMTIISISWMIFRPWLAAGMFCAAISPFLFCARSLVNTYERVNVNEAADWKQTAEPWRYKKCVCVWLCVRACKTKREELLVYVFMLTKQIIKVIYMIRV